MSPPDHHSTWRVSPREAWRQYLRLYRGDYPRFLSAIALSTAPPAIAAASALLIRRKFDSAFKASDPWQIAWLTAAFIAIQFAGTLVTLAARALTLWVTKSATARLRSRIFEALLALSQRTGDRTSTATLHTIAIEDPERIDTMSSVIVTGGLPAAAGAIFLGGMAVYISPRLSLMLVLLVPAMVGLMKYIRRRARALSDRSRSAQARLSGSVFSAIRLLALIRTQAAEAESIANHDKRIEEVRANAVRVNWIYTIYPVLQTTLVIAISGIVLLVGGLAIRSGKMTAGELMAFFAAVLLLRSQFAPLTFFGAQVTAGENALERSFGFLELAEPEPYQGTRKIDFDGSITVENVSFDYGNDIPVLRQVSLNIGRGNIVALTGENGSGKSTLLHLLLGLYAPVSGRLLASGVPYSELDIRHLRSQIGFVGQDSMLLDASVRDNVTFGSRGISDDEIMAAAAHACATDFFLSLPQGLDTRVGEDGVLLSGGQRQRIALTRALLRRPDLLVLDEPTNHLDRETVAAFLRSLRRVDWPHGTLVVTHDPTVIAEADEVLRFVQGQVTVIHGRARLVGSEAVS